MRSSSRSGGRTRRHGAAVYAAARVGGILANSTYPAEFIHDNLAIQTNVVHEAWRAGVRRLLFLGSSCIYPRDCPQPIREDALLTGGRGLALVAMSSTAWGASIEPTGKVVWFEPAERRQLGMLLAHLAPAAGVGFGSGVDAARAAAAMVTVRQLLGVAE